MKTKIEITIEAEIDFDYMPRMLASADSPAAEEYAVINEIIIDREEVERKYQQAILDAVFDRIEDQS